MFYDREMNLFGLLRVKVKNAQLFSKAQGKQTKN